MPKPPKKQAQSGDWAHVLPARIKALREGAGLTATALDRLTGLCLGTSGRLERGDQKIYASHLFRIAQATGVDVGWFYGPPEHTPPAGRRHDSEQQRLLRAYMRIRDARLKRDVFELIESLAERLENDAE